MGVSSESTAEQLEMQKKYSLKQKMSFERTEQTKIKILIELRNSILFKNMSHNYLMKIIERMTPKEFSAGDIVIDEGDDGNELFIVDEGYFRCVVPNRRKN